MPSPVGEGGSRRLTDEAFFPRSRFCCKITHSSSSTASRSPFSNRRRQGRRAKVGGRESVRVVGAPTPTGENKCCIFDEKSAGERAHSSSTAERSPFSGRRRHGVERKSDMLTEGWRENRRCRSSGAPTPTGKNKCCIFDEKSAEERAHSSSTAERSPFSGRRKHGVERWLGLPTEGRRKRERAGRRGRRPLQGRGGQICLLRWEKVAADG